METIQKINVNKISEDIKKLSTEQRSLKNQRKTVNLVGERIMEPYEAWYKHYLNRKKLRMLYAVFGLICGKSFSQIENKYTEEEHPLNEYKKRIDDIISSYILKE